MFLPIPKTDSFISSSDYSNFRVYNHDYMPLDGYSWEHARSVIITLQKHGHQAYLVGGAIRNALLGTSPKDYDIATSALPHEIKKIFKRNSRVIGKRFPIVLVWKREAGVNYEVEVTTFRRRHTRSVFSEKPINDNYGYSLLEDAGRRDFSINSLYYDPCTHEIYDPFGGIKDLEDLSLRTIGDSRSRVQEDPLRMLRALRLMAHYGFKMDMNLQDNIISQSRLIRQVNPFRLRSETIKTLLGGNAKSTVDILYTYGFFEQLFVMNFNYYDLSFLEDGSKFKSVDIFNAGYEVLDRITEKDHSHEFHSVNIMVRVLQQVMWPYFLSLLGRHIDIGVTPLKVTIPIMLQCSREICSNLSQVLGDSQSANGLITDSWTNQIRIMMGDYSKVSAKNYKYVRELAESRLNYGGLNQQAYDELVQRGQGMKLTETNPKKRRRRIQTVKHSG